MATRSQIKQACLLVAKQAEINTKKASELGKKAKDIEALLDDASTKNNSELLAELETIKKELKNICESSAKLSQKMDYIKSIKFD